MRTRSIFPRKTEFSFSVQAHCISQSLVVVAWLVSQPIDAMELATEEPVEPQTTFEKINYDNVSSGTLYLAHTAGGLSEGTQLNTSLAMTISGMVSNVTLVQSFENTSPEWVEGIYIFPLPAEAAVNRMQIEAGDRSIEGRIMEKQQAAQQYQLARVEGKVASLVSQQRPNLFTTRIANIGPGETVRVTLSYVETLSYRDEKFSLRFPMTLTPRYNNDQVADRNNLTPPQHYPGSLASPTVTLNATLHTRDAVETLSSPSHELALTQHEDYLAISFPGAQLMDQDLILEWSPSLEQTPAISSWRETVGDDDYLLAMLLPPRQLGKSTQVERELILVMDTSGSMAGQSIEAARKTLHYALDGLQSGDRFNLIDFNSSARRLFTTSVDVSDQNLQRARQYVDGLQADGGTEMQSAIALALANPVAGYLRQVVFVTDGSVGNEDQLFQQINTSLRQARLFTVGIGSAPNSYFMQKAAQAGRGSYTWVNQARNAQARMNQLLRMLENPALTDIQIEWHGDIADYSPSPIADLYLGEPLILSAKLKNKTTGFTVTGHFGTELWEHQVDIRDTPIADSGLSVVWARQKISALLDAQRRSLEPDKYKNSIIRIALDHKLISPYTSMTAIDTTPVRAPATPLATAPVSSLMPTGASMAAVNFPHGARGSDTLLWVAMFCLLLSAFIYVTTLLSARLASNRKNCGIIA